MRRLTPCSGTMLDGSAGPGPPGTHDGERRRLHADLPQLYAAAAGTDCDAAVRSLFADASDYDVWAARWRERITVDTVDPDTRCATMQAVSPAFMPRNHMVEAAPDAAVARQDFAPFEELLEVLSRPYEDRPHREHYAVPPTSEERVQQTFWGT